MWGRFPTCPTSAIRGRESHASPDSLRTCSELKRDRAYRSNPAADFRRICLVHIEKMRHDRLYCRFAAVVWLHGDDAPKNLDGSAIPVFGDIVMRGKSRVDKCSQTLTDLLASLPFSDAEATCGIFYKAVETRTEGLIVDFFPEGQQLFRQFGFGHR